MKKKAPAKTSKRRGGVAAYTKRELILDVAREGKVTQEVARDVVQRTIDLMVDTLVSGRTIEIRDFGIFETVTRRKRIGRNPKKPEETVDIPSRKAIKFRPGRKFRDRLAATMKKK